MALKEIWKQFVIVTTMMMMASMASNDYRNSRDDCRVKTKLYCTRIKFNSYVPYFPDNNETMCCNSKYVDNAKEKYKEMCDRCIDISGSSLQLLYVSTFNKFPNITYVDISNNSLKELKKTLFYNTVQISHLNLSYNNLEYLYNTTFKYTIQLSIFDLSYNSLKNLNYSLFSTTTELSNLNLSHNKLENLHNRTFFETTKLYHLDMSYNSLTNLSATTFLTTTELQYLNLSHNLLQKLDNRILHTTVELSHLDLSYNKLEFICEELFFTLKKLRYLNLKNNQISILDNERLFISQKKLSSLILANNRFTDIKVKILMPLEIIRDLDLSENPLNCSCNLRMIMKWCKEHGVDTNTSCMNTISNTSVSWIILNNFTDCEQNISIYSDSSNGEGKGGRCYDLDIWIGIIVVSMLLSLALGCILSLVLTYCWRSYKKTSSEEREAIVDSTYDNTTDSYYYPSAMVAGEHVTSFCTPPELPERPSLEQASNFPYKNEYVDNSTSLHYTVKLSRKGNLNNVTRHTTSSGNNFPKEIIVVNDLYK